MNETDTQFTEVKTSCVTLVTGVILTQRRLFCSLSIQQPNEGDQTGQASGHF